MNLLTRARNALVPWRQQKAVPPQGLSPVGGWSVYWPRVLESFAGAWQSNVTVDRVTVSAYWAVFACTTLIAKDISKMYVRVMQQLADGTAKETRTRGPVLRRPNSYQTRTEFFFLWIMSELLEGNTYILKVRDENRFVKELHILNPGVVIPLVTPDGEVYYRISADNLAGIKEKQIIAPASEIIHDRMYTLHHPLLGVSPIYACGVAAVQGLAIQDNSAKFFQNQSRPSGVLTAPGPISPEDAEALKTAWDANFGAGKIGKTAVMGDGLKYVPLSMSAHDSQLIEQLKMTAEMVAACYHVPGYKIGVGQMPTVNNTAALNQQYYDQCLQYIIEKMEARLDEGLEIEEPEFIEFDLGGLLRMDPMTRYDAHNKAIAGAWKMPNEVRKEENMPPVEGGNTVFMQSQNQSLAALAARDENTIEGAENVQGTAMNGAQVTSLREMLMAVAAGQMPKATAKAAIGAAYPSLEETEINDMIDPIVEGSAPPTTGSTPKPPATKPDTEQDEEIDEAELALIGLYRKNDLESLTHAQV